MDVQNVHTSEFEHIASVLVRDKDIPKDTLDGLGHAAGNVYGEGQFIHDVVSDNDGIAGPPREYKEVIGNPNKIIYPQAVEIRIYKGFKITDKHRDLLMEIEDLEEKIGFTDAHQDGDGNWVYETLPELEEEYKQLEKLIKEEEKKANECYFIEHFYLFESSDGKPLKIAVGDITWPDSFYTAEEIRDLTRETDYSDPWCYEYEGIAGGRDTEVFDSLNKAVKAAENRAKQYKSE